MPPDVPAEHLRWLVLPNFSYDSDDKLGFGARGEVVRPGGDPYKWALVLHAFATTNGYHHHRFRFDYVGDVRVTGHFAFRAWLNDGYWGVGDGTTRGDDGEDGKRYRYSLVQPFAQVAVRREIVGPLSVFASVNGRWSEVRTYPGSLLAEEQPLGMDGGLVGQLATGVLWDTREPEMTPAGGVLLEASVRGVTGAYSFAGPFLSARGWLQIGARVVVGERIMGEWLFGDVPFYEMVHWGGSVPIAGFGGADTLRGISFGRWRGPGKALSNTEVRIDVVSHRLLKRDLRWQLVPFTDSGIVWGAGDPGPIHPTAGLGVRIIVDETMVGRIDGAVGQDLAVDGPALSWGSYLMFDHMF